MPIKSRTARKNGRMDKNQPDQNRERRGGGGDGDVADAAMLNIQ